MQQDSIPPENRSLEFFELEPSERFELFAPLDHQLVSSVLPKFILIVNGKFSVRDRPLEK